MARTGKFARLKKKGKKDNETVDETKVDAVKTEANKNPAEKVVKTEGKKPEAKAGTQPKQEQVGGKEKSDLAGLIFMCNRSTKDDCFKYRVLGLPEAKKNIVEQVRRNMRLFLYDVDLRIMYGIYKASSRGGYNLQSEAFRGSKKAFPWQVRFSVLKDCLPLPENVFKKAIKENYYDNKKFKHELTFEQVEKLRKLFRPVPSDGGAGGPPPQRAPPLVRLDPPPRGSFEPKFPVQEMRPPPRAIEPSFADDLQLAREIRMRRELGAPEYLPPPVSHPAYGSDPILSELELRKTDPYLLGVKDDYPAYSQLHTLGNPPVDAGPLYRQRFQQAPDVRGDVLDRRAYGLDPLIDGAGYGGISGEILRKRALDDAYADERGLLARNLDLQRRLPLDDTSAIPGAGRFTGISPLGRHYLGR